MRPIDGDVLVTIVREGLEQNPHKEGLARVCHRTEYLHFLDVIQRMPTIAPPPNDPLTLEELREMEGEPVYDALEDQWCVVEDVNYYDEFYSQIVMTDGTMLDTNEDGASCFLGRLYRRKPEEDRDTVPPKTADWAEHFKARFERVE